MGRQALRFHQSLFRIEREIEDKAADERQRIRQRKSRRVLAVFHRWLLTQRRLVPPGSATIRAIDYSLKRWSELTHFVNDGDVPISNNWVENHIRPGKIELAVRRKPARGQESSRDHEPTALGPDQWA